MLKFSLKISGSDQWESGYIPGGRTSLVTATYINIESQQCFNENAYFIVGGIRQRKAFLSYLFLYKQDKKKL